MTSPFSFTAKTDGVDDHLAAHVNALQNAADVLAKTAHGVLLNGRIAVSVSSNNLVVAIKTYDNGNPSASDPVYVRINNTIRILTTSLTFTLTAGLNYFNSGGVEFATQEVDYFVYLIWNTAPVTDAIDICIARVPFGRVVSDFSATITNEKYLANSLGSPTSTDEVALIGRFAATLSGTAAFLWSVPTFTARNLIQEPVTETRALTYATVWASSGTQPAIGDGTIAGQYKIRGKEMIVRQRTTAGSTTTYGTGAYTWSLPLTAATFTNANFAGSGRVYDLSATTAYVGYVNIASAGTTMNMTTHAAASAASATVPVTLANGDQLYTQAEYALA